MKWPWSRAIEPEIGESRALEQPSHGSTGAHLTDHAEAPRRGDRELIQAINEMPTLRMVVGKIADSLAAVPLVVEVGGRVVDNHPLLDLLNRPNAHMTQGAFRRLQHSYMELSGECFSVLERGGRGVPVEMWLLNPSEVVETPSQTRDFFVHDAGKTQLRVDPDDMLWFRNHDPANPYGRGQGIVRALADELDADNFAAQTIKSWFFNKASPDLFIGVQGASEGALRDAKAKYEGRHRGYRKMFSSFWHGGDITVEKVNTSFAEQQLIELRKFERDIVVNTFGIPPEVLGIIENANRATITSSEKLFVNGVLIPRLNAYCEFQTQSLAPEFGANIRVTHALVGPKDQDISLEAIKSTPWAYTVNEIRAVTGDPPLDDGGDLHMAAGVTFVGSLEITESDVIDASPIPMRDYLTSRAMDGDAFAESVAMGIGAAELAGVRGALASVIEFEGSKMMTEIGGAGARFSMQDVAVMDHLQNVSSTRIVRIADTTRDIIRAALVEGVAAGEGRDEMALRIKKVFKGSSTYRTKMIAQTEVVRSSGFARHQAMVNSGVVPLKYWLTGGDTKVRMSHRELGAHPPILVDGYFEADGERAQHPGDFGRGDLDINCRCVVVPTFKNERAEDPEKIDAEAKANAMAYIERTYDHQDDLEKVLRDAFAEQEKKVLARINIMAAFV